MSELRTNPNDITIGTQYGYWTVVNNYYRKGKNNDAYFPCECRCGTQRDVRLRQLRTSQSCGCFQKEVMANKRKYFFDPGTKGYDWARGLWASYRMTTKEFHQLMLTQSGLCAICSDQLIDPHVDHCHTTLRVRGILCHHCNTLLGLAKDDIIVLEQAISYLRQAIVND